MTNLVRPASCDTTCEDASEVASGQELCSGELVDGQVDGDEDETRTHWHS